MQGVVSGRGADTLGYVSARPLRYKAHVIHMESDMSADRLEMKRVIMAVWVAAGAIFTEIMQPAYCPCIQERAWRTENRREANR
ncbi:hypothetical protein AQ611_17840 [Burkholderia singularis]|nr:hypothetical protein AQ611_17840 [Burkholderia sp. Bp7605]